MWRVPSVNKYHCNCTYLAFISSSFCSHMEHKNIVNVSDP